ncbi:hypothetical protein ACFL6U_28615 [Planctomycetota bacterium]
MKVFILFAQLFFVPTLCSAEFIHPGLLHNRAELDFIKAKVQAKEEPWISGWHLKQVHPTNRGTEPINPDLFLQELDQWNTRD